MKRLRVALLAIASLGAYGCGSDEGGSSMANGSAGIAGDGSDGGSAGTAANASSGTTSGGGRNFAGSSAAGGGAAGGGAAGSGGLVAMAGSGSVELPDAVFDPTLPEPSVDCRTQVDTKRCVSIRGQVNDGSVDAHCTSQALVNLTFEPPRAWVADCTEGPTPEMGKQYQVAIPVQKIGTFEYQLTPDSSSSGASVLISVDDVGGSTLADHFESGVLSGVVEDGGLGAALISGTFRARWTAPATDCDAGAVGHCGAVAVNGTFRILHSVPPL